MLYDNEFDITKKNGTLPTDISTNKSCDKCVKNESNPASPTTPKDKEPVKTMEDTLRESVKKASDNAEDAGQMRDALGKRRNTFLNVFTPSTPKHKKSLVKDEIKKRLRVESDDNIEDDLGATEDDKDDEIYDLSEMKDHLVICVEYFSSFHLSAVFSIVENDECSQNVSAAFSISLYNVEMFETNMYVLSS
jgi:hypothetical protein